MVHPSFLSLGIDNQRIYLNPHHFSLLTNLFYVNLPKKITSSKYQLNKKYATWTYKDNSTLQQRFPLVLRVSSSRMPYEILSFGISRPHPSQTALR